jgi:hypothetical protein
MNELHPKSARHRTMSRFSSSKGHGLKGSIHPQGTAGYGEHCSLMGNVIGRKLVNDFKK